MTTFKELGLSPEIINSILDAGYSTPTPVQAQAIPIASSGKDLIGCAQTGTGKTAAFVLPMLTRLQQNPRPKKGRPVRALVVAPTRELALQVKDAVNVYGKYSKFRAAAIYGGVPMHPQLKSLRRGVDIIIATPGRLLDHVRRGSLDLSQVEILVLDEADRMLDMGFLPDITTVVRATPKNRQTLLFSATMPGPVHKLAKTIMRDPQMIEIGERHNPADTVTQQVCLVSQGEKMNLLLHVLQTEQTDNVLVFSRTKHGADRITKKLDQSGFTATAMHSNKSQGQRQRALGGFKSGQFQIMVATDIAARGIDVDSISHVINFDTPNQAEDYIHRIGRTGRARATGDAITFVASNERAYLKRIENHTGSKLDRKIYADFEGAMETEAPRSSRSRSGSSGRSFGKNARRSNSYRRG